MLTLTPRPDSPLAIERAKYQQLTGALLEALAEPRLEALAEPPHVMPDGRATADDIREECAHIAALADAAHAIVLHRLRRLADHMPDGPDIDAHDAYCMREPVADLLGQFEWRANRMEAA